MAPTSSAAKKSSPSAAPPAKSSTMKQGTLFSFFSKTTNKTEAKTSSDTNSKVQVQGAQDATSDSSKKTSSQGSDMNLGASKAASTGLIKEATKPTQQDAISEKDKSSFSNVHVGTRISVYWPDDEEYYPAKVTSKSQNGTIFTLLYDDGDVEHVDLRKEDFKILSSPSSKTSDAPSLEKKKRKIIDDDDDDDEEFEFEEDIDMSDDDDDEEEYTAKKRKVNTDEDSVFQSDDDDEAGVHLNKRGEKTHSADVGKRLRITPHTDAKVTSANVDNANRSSRVLGANSTGGLKQVSKTVPTTQEKTKNSVTFITPPPKSVSKSLDLSKFSTKADAPKDGPETITPSPRWPTQSPQTPNQVKKPLPDSSIVNSVGTHWHNHFSFLTPEKRRDLKNRPMTHPDYDSRTLHVDYHEIERVTQSKLTPAARQWWEIKAQYADTLLLFKTGKFYEIFHMDADIAVQVLGFTYMKGAIAHAGFPEIGYGGFCDRLVRAGHKVARVEQTETPEMLKERKSATKGVKPQVINREVCSIVSSGTRTFCYLDDTKLLEDGNDDSTVGPLLAIKESLVISDSVSQSSSPEDDDDSSMKPSCEYGIVIVDAIRGVITLGQFADDLLRSRMNTLLTSFRPSEVLIEGTNVSSTLHALLKSLQSTTLPFMTIETIKGTESFPKSTAVHAEARQKYERPTPLVHPWDVKETLTELHRRAYYPRSSRKAAALNEAIDSGISRWPDVLKACVNGGADLALSAFGSALFYLQRALIDEEILGMGIVKAYCPPEVQTGAETDPMDTTNDVEEANNAQNEGISRRFLPLDTSSTDENNIDHMSLDGTTITNLEILTNSHSNSAAGSLWSKINRTKSSHGSRLLKAWLLRPLFRKEDIDRRADAVEELISGSGALAMTEARAILSKLGDMERLLSRVHSMSGNGNENSHHPNERAVLYETATHTKRKVGDFSKLLNGLRAASKIPDIFEAAEIRSGLLHNIVRLKEQGGLFPDVKEHLDWFFDNFDCDKAAKGHFEPSRGIDEDYDTACDTVTRIKHELEAYQKEMCQNILRPTHIAKSQWAYINTKDDSKDKYIIELPVSVQVPNDFMVKGKRGSGPKQVNKYRTPVVEQLVDELENALEVIKNGKDRGMQLIFAKFDSMRSVWSLMSQASALLDALGALAEIASSAGLVRPTILNYSVGGSPIINIVKGRHPCVESTYSGGAFIPNDLYIGDANKPRVLLLSGPNMGGKSTLLRQTCLITILSQIGSWVPAESCSLTPIDRIFTRLGASDRLLLGQSTFFVELAETGAALRGASSRSLVIMDELGRGTSTFDGTAIASATVKHLVERNKCLALFSTHYHTLLEDWKEDPSVRLGHMECVVENETTEVDRDEDGVDNTQKQHITFLYTLGDGSCPKSFGINVAKLAGLPDEVLSKARTISTNFEAEMNGALNSRVNANRRFFSADHALDVKTEIAHAVRDEDWPKVKKLWTQMQDVQSSD